jgi:hypothetical protein
MRPQSRAGRRAKYRLLDSPSPSEAGETAKIDRVPQRSGIAQRKQKGGVHAAVPGVKGAHRAVSRFVKQLPVARQRADIHPVILPGAPGLASQPVPPGAVSHPRTDETEGLQTLTDGAQDAQLSFPRVARHCRQTVEDAVERNGIEPFPSQGKTEEVRANRVYRQVHLVGAKIDERRPFHNVFDSNHARQCAAHRRHAGAPAISDFEDCGIGR